MIRIPSPSKTLLCAMLVGGLVPATGTAKPENQPDLDLSGAEQINPARPPRLVIVKADMTEVYFECTYMQNVGQCLDAKTVASGGTSSVDSNRYAQFAGGAARVGSSLGGRAVSGYDYSYDSLYIEGDMKVYATE